MKAIIIGRGKSGQAAEKFLTGKGWETAILDSGDEMPSADLCVLSPGVPWTNGEVKAIPELELPFVVGGVKPKKVVAVTGTNGKTTVVGQIHTACSLDDKESVLCGNVGIPISSVADSLDGKIAVVEVSSFMLEQSTIFRPDIAVITNITPDHLERHRTAEEYMRCKGRITAHQGKGDYLVANFDDERVRAIGKEAEKLRRQTVVWFSAAQRRIWTKFLFWRKRLCPLPDLERMTPHGRSNALASLTAAHLLGIDKAAASEAVQPKEQKHRIEKVCEKNGVAFYNDSKATNIASTLAACKCFSGSIRLILSGKTKGQNYDDLFDGLPENVVDVIAFGDLTAEMKGRAKIVDGLEKAVVTAAQGAKAGDVILFSPSGSSFDRFENYEDRGNQFCDAVKQYIF
jgi:UDP-N-acetylmuramoylalanine--D-glutamate ligase